MNLTTMLVIVMFATILTIGMANTLMALAGLINERENKTHYWINNSWLMWLFIMHLNMYWYSSHIAQVEDWGFPGFLHVITGPVLLFFATSIFLNRDSKEGESEESKFFNVSRKFFLFFVFLQIWIMTTDLVLVKGLTGSGFFNLLMAIMGFLLARMNKKVVHRIGAFLSWLLLVIPMILRGFAIIN